MPCTSRPAGYPDAETAPQYPFVPKTTAHLQPGQFWQVPLSDGRFACCRVLQLTPEARYGRISFIAGLLDWLGDELPTAESIAGARVLEFGSVHVKSIETVGGQILGHRDLEADEIVAPRQVNSGWGHTYIKLRAERVLLRPDEAPAWEIRDVKSPLTEEMLRPLRARHPVVQFRSLLTDSDFRTLAEWLRPQPHVRLRAYGSYDGTITDLEFLRHFPFLRRFAADALFNSLTSLRGLRHLSEDLESLTIGLTRRRLDLHVLRRFQSLKSLYLEGQTNGIDVLSELEALEELTLRSITLPDLSLLLPLHRLLALDLKLGGTKDLGLLPEVGDLRYLELWMVKGLSDLSPVGRLPHLGYLFLQSLRRVDSLPDLSGCHHLRRVHLETMRGLRNLSPLAAAPALEELVLVSMSHLRPEDLQPFAGHPTLRGATLGLGSLRKNAAAREIVGVPDLGTTKAGWRAVVGLDSDQTLC